MSEGTQTLNRALTLLEASAEMHELDKLAETINVSRSTAYRLLTALTERGYLRHEPRAGYYLGPRLMQLGFKVYSDIHLSSIAHPHLVKASKTIQETIHLAVLENDRGVYIDVLPGSRELQMASKIGGQIFPQCTALGKILVSGLPENRWAEFFSKNLKRTENTITNIDIFLNDLKMVKETGLAFDIEENELGIMCIAAPIFDVKGNVVAAISFAGATVYLDKNSLDKLAPFLLQTAKDISADLGWSDIS